MAGENCVFDACDFFMFAITNAFQQRLVKMCSVIHL